MSPNQILVLGTVRAGGPLTAYEISELSGLSPLAVKPRLNELVKSGVFDCYRRKNKSDYWKIQYCLFSCTKIKSATSQNCSSEKWQKGK